MRDFMKAIAAIGIFAVMMGWFYIVAFIIMGGLEK